MSGIEAAGLVLAAIPLILEAFDRSERTFEFFRTCGKYAKELTKIESILGAQKLFFRHNCVHLISAITSDPQRAQNMVNTATGENVDWASLVTVNPISSRLTSTLETVQTCQGTILLIQDSLQSIAREVEGFQADIGPGRNVSSGHSPSQRFNASFSIFDDLKWQSGIEYSRATTLRLILIEGGVPVLGR